MGFIQVQVYPADGSSNGELSLRLGVHLPESYPSASSPVAELHAPWLSENTRRRLVEMLTNLYEESVGEVVVFRWVEWLKVITPFLLSHILVIFVCTLLISHGAIVKSILVFSCRATWKWTVCDVNIVSSRISCIANAL